MIWFEDIHTTYIHRYIAGMYVCMYVCMHDFLYACMCVYVRILCMRAYMYARA